MKLTSFAVLRLVTFFIASSLLVLLLSAMLIPLWITKSHRVEDEAKALTNHVHEGLLARIDQTAMLLSQLNQSAPNLQTFLKSSVLNQTVIPFSTIKTEVAPVLFEALSTIPQLCQISYIASDGLFFSFYVEGNQPFAVYSNDSSPFFLNSTTNHTLYTQPAYRDSGQLYGEAMKTSASSLIIAKLLQEALKRKNVYTSLGIGWDSDQQLVLLNTIAIDERRALSLGFHVKPLVGFLTAGLSAFNGSLYLAANDGTVLSSGMQSTVMVLAGNADSLQLFNSQGDQLDFAANISCQLSDGARRGTILEMLKMKYVFYCSPLDFAGLKMVYVLALPYEGLDSLMNQNLKFASAFLITTMAAMVLAILGFTSVIIRCTSRETHLCAALIKQLEATQQAERKSMNKSVALSNASHDIRTSLAGIIGLIEMCREDVLPRSEMEMSLIQAEACANDLLGILNSILDASKIEAGKMQLEEEEFDLEQLLEDVVDLFHPIGMKKEVDVLLDPYDGSIRKYSQVKGDRVKLKQILCNLLSNAIKFTSEGHVSVRVSAQKPSFPNEILTPPRRNKSKRCVSCFILPSEGSYSELEAVNNFQYDERLMEFIFEVNDTGKGIPKERHQTVFENYIQVKDAASGPEGTGLGLGIVQSLVRLMGGEIAIVDEEIGERGTCFRFSIFLTVCGNKTRFLSQEDDVESVPSTHFCCSKPEGSYAVLFVTSVARSRMLQKYMENQGIKVYAVNQYEQLAQTLKMIKENLVISCNSSKRVADVSSRSHQSMSENSRSKDINLSPIEGTDHLPSSSRRAKSQSTQKLILIVIDTSAGPFRKISRAVAEFRRDLVSAWSRVVWIDRPGAHSLNVQGLDADKLPSTDLIFSKPLHGSRLYQLIGLLPEFGGTMAVQRTKGESASNKVPMLPRPSEKISTNDRIAQENYIQNRNKPLAGKKILVAEDNAVLRKLATTIVSRLGADVYTCQNGEEALELVCKHLSEQRKQGMHLILPFACILMDCEMPVMDGYEATKRIREEEKHFGWHIPIVALTAHAADVERNRMREAGMDYYLSKPLKEEQILEVLSQINKE